MNCDVTFNKRILSFLKLFYPRNNAHKSCYHLCVIEAIKGINLEHIAEYPNFCSRYTTYMTQYEENTLKIYTQFDLYLDN